MLGNHHQTDTADVHLLIAQPPFRLQHPHERFGHIRWSNRVRINRLSLAAAENRSPVRPRLSGRFRHLGRERGRFFVRWDDSLRI